MRFFVRWSHSRRILLHPSLDAPTVLIFILLGAPLSFSTVTRHRFPSAQDLASILVPVQLVRVIPLIHQHHFVEIEVELQDPLQNAAGDAITAALARP